MSIVITVDGPAASGKSSVSRGLAKALGWKWVSTGAFYRGLAYVAYKEGIDPSDTEALVKLCSSEIWSVEMDIEETRVLYKGENVSSQIQAEKVGDYASKISPIPEVRAALLQAQRDCAQRTEKGLVAEGRDCGTVVFPNAKLKIFLTARGESRAARRAAEQGKDVGEILKAQEKRDHQDSSRKTAPLRPADDAHVIDTSELGLDEVIQKVRGLADTIL